MKNVEKKVNTEVGDYVTDYMTSNISIGGHGYPSSQREHLLYMTKIQVLLISKQTEVN